MNGKDTACFSRQSDEWETPQDLFDQLDAEFHFNFDAAATYDNCKVCFFSDDSLNGRWTKDDYTRIVWLNPPYSKIAAFMKKAYEESQKGATVVCLIPVRSDTRYWHDYVMKAQEIRFIKGRLKFGGAENGAPFPSCIVIFRPNCTKYYAGGPEAFRPEIGKTIEQPKKGGKTA